PWLRPHGEQALTCEQALTFCFKHSLFRAVNSPRLFDKDRPVEDGVVTDLLIDKEPKHVAICASGRFQFDDSLIQSKYFGFDRIPSAAQGCTVRDGSLNFF